MNIFEKCKQGFQWMKFQDDIGEPPWEYDFLVNLDEREYPKYLKKIFKYRTGKELNLRHPKTFNEKIQWLKLYDATPLKRDLTDKVKVRDYVREKIGEEYLKPVLQICDSFDEIDFEKLPNSFVMKCNHGCKWQYIIKKKEEYLNTPKLMEITKRQMTGWLEQNYSIWGGLELQYRGIEQKILIEPLMRDKTNTPAEEIQVYCFSGNPKIIIRLYNDGGISIYDEKLNPINDIFGFSKDIKREEADNIIKQSFVLSKNISKNFKFVRTDWMLYQNKLYFEEFTFTPNSGLSRIINEQSNIKLGNLININK